MSHGHRDEINWSTWILSSVQLLMMPGPFFGTWSLSIDMCLYHGSIVMIFWGWIIHVEVSLGVCLVVVVVKLQDSMEEFPHSFSPGNSHSLFRKQKSKKRSLLYLLLFFAWKTWSRPDVLLCQGIFLENFEQNIMCVKELREAPWPSFQWSKITYCN